MPELEHCYHNHELHPTAVGVDMLYARFAWSIFTLLDASCSSPLTPTYLPTTRPSRRRTPGHYLHYQFKHGSNLSDPESKWKKEHDWSQRVWNGETLTSGGVAQWLEAVGVDIRDV